MENKNITQTINTDIDALETIRMVAKKQETERAFVFGYLQGLEAAALLQKERKTA